MNTGGTAFQNYQRAFYRIFFLLAPVIYAGKPAVLVNFNLCHSELYQLWLFYRNFLCKFLAGKLSIETFPIQQSKENQIVLFYKENRLLQTLCEKGNNLFLQNIGYPDGHDLYSSLKTLQQRFIGTCPHEMGIFLGIPRDDVAGFISNQGKNYLFKKYWKVYGHPEQAQAVFQEFDQARLTVNRIFSKLGVSDGNGS